MKAPKFMFINKTVDSDSLSHSNKSERIQIHSHVQKGRRYKKSEGGIIYATQLPILQPTRRSSDHDGLRAGLDGETSKETCTPLTTGPQSLQSHFQVSVARQEPQFSAEVQDPNIDPLLWDYQQLYANTSSVSPQSIPIFPSSAAENFDPFEVTCVKVDQSVHSLLQYFLRVHHPNIWHLERAVRSDHAYAFRSDAMSIIQGCLHDEYNMYSLLACMASYMTYIDDIQSSGDGNYYIHKALRASQKYVQSGPPITGRMIFNVFQMGCAEWYRFNLEGGEIHLRAAKSMVDSLGGLKVLEGPLVEMMLIGDGYVAAEMRKKPLWSDADFDNGDEHPMTAYGLQELQKLLSGTVSIGSGLLTSAQQHIIPPNLRWVVLDLAVVLSILQTAQQSSERQSAPQPPGGLHWVYIRNIAIRHRLLHMDLDDTRSDAVRIAIVLWMFMCFTVAGRKRTVKVVAPFLRETLLTIPEEEWQGHEEVRLWVLTIGALSASAGQKDHSWFVAQINASPVGALGDPDEIFNAVVALSDKFFYLESAQQTNVRLLADTLHAVRSMRKKSRSKSTSKGKSKSPKS